jgi:hypothetical protein
MATRQFCKVSPALWRSPRFNALDSDGKVLALYFLTSMHQNSAGCYAIPKGYAMSDLGWQRNRYESALSLVIEAGLVAYDDEAEVVYIERWYTHCPPQNEKHAQAIRRIISEIDSDEIRERAEADFDIADSMRSGKPGDHLTSTGFMGGRR